MPHLMGKHGSHVPLTTQVFDTYGIIAGNSQRIGIIRYLTHRLDAYLIEGRVSALDYSSIYHTARIPLVSRLYSQGVVLVWPIEGKHICRAEVSLYTRKTAGQ